MVVSGVAMRLMGLTLGLVDVGVDVDVQSSGRATYLIRTGVFRVVGGGDSLRHGYFYLVA